MTQPIKSFADLPLIQFNTAEKPAAPKKERLHVEVEPIFLKKLAAGKTQKEVADKLSISAATVSAALANNAVWKIIEMASQLAYEAETPPPAPELTLNGKVVFTAAVQKEAWTALKPWLEQAGATFKTLAV